jgi:hypothetical protein
MATRSTMAMGQVEAHRGRGKQGCQKEGKDGKEKLPDDFIRRLLLR